jgi:hypothetical protein
VLRRYYISFCTSVGMCVKMLVDQFCSSVGMCIQMLLK